MECGILLQPLLSLAKEVMCFLSLLSSPTGQDLLFYHCDFLRVAFVCLPGLTSFFVIYRDIPTSFQSSFGRVLHGLQAQLKRTKKLTRWATANINFISKPNVNIPRLMVRSCRVNGPGGTRDSRVIVMWV